MEPSGHDLFLLLWALLGLAVAVGLFFTPAPYGRHSRRGWGPTVDAKWGWVVMEATAALVLPALFDRLGPPRRHFVGIRRAVGDPLPAPRLRLPVPARQPPPHTVGRRRHGRRLQPRQRLPERHVPLRAGAPGGADWLTTPRFLVGLAVFVAGMALNLDSDNRLLRLRRESRDYAVPHGGGFRWVSCPNYLGEILEWTGFAIATASPAAWVFAWWTVANLAPRAWAHHRWYRELFENYPATRRALVPFLW